MICSFADGVLWQLLPTLCEEVFWFDRSLNKMTAGDWAGWAQFLGAMLAIGFAWTQARQGEKRRILEEGRQKVINYEIAEDMFRRISDSVYKAANAVKSGVEKPFFAGDVLSEAKSSLDMLDKLVMSPLPSREAAIDVQMMRILGFHAYSQLARAKAVVSVPESGVFGILLAPLSDVQDYAYMERGETGPLDVCIVQKYRRWRKAERPDMGIFEEDYAVVEAFDFEERPFYGEPPIFKK